MSRYISLVSIVFSLVFCGVAKVCNSDTLDDPGGNIPGTRSRCDPIGPGAGCYVNRIAAGDAFDRRKNKKDPY